VRKAEGIVLHELTILTKRQCRDQLIVQRLDQCGDAMKREKVTHLCIKSGDVEMRRWEVGSEVRKWKAELIRDVKVKGVLQTNAWLFFFVCLNRRLLTCRDLLLHIYCTCCLVHGSSGSKLLDLQKVELI
jgi:hypothetical protein